MGEHAISIFEDLEKEADLLNEKTKILANRSAWVESTLNVSTTLLKCISNYVMTLQLFAHKGVFHLFHVNIILKGLKDIKSMAICTKP